MSFIPSISLPSNTLSLAFKRRYSPSDKLRCALFSLPCTIFNQHAPTYKNAIFKILILNLQVTLRSLVNSSVILLVWWHLHLKKSYLNQPAPPIAMQNWKFDFACQSILQFNELFWMVPESGSWFEFAFYETLSFSQRVSCNKEIRSMSITSRGG